MLTSRPFLRWIAMHLLVFLFSPFCFMLAGILSAVLLSVEPYLFGARSPLSSGLMAYYNRGLYLLAPFIAGLLLGGATSCLQILAMRNSPMNIKPIRWMFAEALGMALAFLAFAWAASSPVFASPLLMAALFSACVYGLVCALPQSRLLKTQVEETWPWLLFSSLAALLAFPLVFAPVWLPEGALYFWLIFLFAAAGGILFGFLVPGWFYFIPPAFSAPDPSARPN